MYIAIWSGKVFFDTMLSVIVQNHLLGDCAQFEKHFQTEIQATFFVWHKRIYILDVCFASLRFESCYNTDA